MAIGASPTSPTVTYHASEAFGNRMTTTAAAMSGQPRLTQLLGVPQLQGSPPRASVGSTGRMDGMGVLIR
jgi:hypothetical protein